MSTCCRSPLCSLRIIVVFPSFLDCSHQYEGPVDPTSPIVADAGDDSGEELVRAELVGEHSIPDRDVCIAYIPSDARPCFDCYYSYYLFQGVISCTFGPAEAGFNSVKLTYKFAPRMFHTD